MSVVPAGFCFKLHTTGVCKYGASCKFRHDRYDAQGGAAPPTVAGSGGAPAGCCFSFFHTGSCAKGDFCRFTHVARDAGAGLPPASPAYTFGVAASPPAPAGPSVAAAAVTASFQTTIVVSGAPSTLTVTSTNDPAALARWVGEHVLGVARAGRQTVVGFDTETRPAFRKGESYPVSLLQLYVRGAREALVAHIGAQQAPAVEGQDRLAPLRALLECPHVVLVGVAAGPDVQGLREVCGLPPGTARRGAAGAAAGAEERAQVVDLKDASVKLQCAVRGGLQGLAQSLLGALKWKSKRLQLSRWDLFPLSRAQELYAALDAVWGGEIAFELERRRDAMGGGGGGGGGAAAVDASGGGDSQADDSDASA
jgi:ribonuclease D